MSISLLRVLDSHISTISNTNYFGAVIRVIKSIFIKTGNIFPCIPCESKNQKLVIVLENLKMTVWLTIFIKKRKLTKIIITRVIDRKR